MATNTIGAGVVLNEGQIDVDFRVEGNNNANVLMVDGGNDRVGIGTHVPAAVFDVSPVQYSTGTASQSGTTVTGSGTTWTAAMIGSIFLYADGTSSGVITARASNTSITVTTSQTVSSQAYSIHYRVMKLDANSRISLSNNDSGTSNTVFGYAAGASIVSGCDKNVFIGHQVADATLTNAADRNVAIGYHSLSALTSGDRNVAIGAFSGIENTDAGHLTLVGYNAGYKINHTDADGTVCIGNEAGEQLVSGIGNVVIGHQALDEEDDGDYNTAVGYQALTAQTGTSGEVGNTAVGYQAGAAITTGGENTCVGEGAGANITTGGGNTAIGRWTMNSGGSVITGGANTCIGYQAGQTLAGAGATNTFVGGYAGEDTTTGTQNVFVGYGTEGNASGCTNQIAIGYNTTGQADNSVTLGNADVTAVYMSSDSGAVVHCRRSINKHNLVNVVNEISLSGDNGSGDGGSQIQMLYNDSQKWKFYQRNNTTIGSAFAFVLLDAGNDDGVYINQGGSGWTDASDERLKTSIAPIESAVDKLNTLQAINFKWKYGSEERQAKNNIGLLAQEVYKVIPEAVDYHDPEDFKLIDHPTIEGTKQAEGAWGIDKSKLIPVLIKAVQELSQQVEELKAKIN